MDLHFLSRTQQLPISQDVAWAFFANPANLASITPAWLRFRDITPVQAKLVREGYVYWFELRPLGLFPVRWLGEITHVDAPHSFTDEQKMGPFRYWHHTHTMVPVEDGVEVQDALYYIPPPGIFGGMCHGFLRRQLEGMFDYRSRMLEEFFGRMPHHGEPERGVERWKP
jgi:ligand-binding SRPBCC domain-containing protein